MVTENLKNAHHELEGEREARTRAESAAREIGCRLEEAQRCQVLGQDAAARELAAKAQALADAHAELANHRREDALRAADWEDLTSRHRQV